MLCQECPKKTDCKELCPEAVAYVNQDYVPPDEYVLSPEFIDRNFTGEDLKVGDFQKGTYSSAELKKLICVLRIEGKSTREIAHYLPCSHVYVYQVLSKIGTKRLK